ncbi:autoinducer 2 sensor kinase/phosphatase LuxQ [Vibrio maritimus]|uniref:Autoinducer 2 sensor kinase/phosphatase LuxQ n=1 Tax=Vibrio maritimus TaxID=990268 RepID=A0A090RVF2_9VIBR|nr:autoinducer 2 sensor kinase/phosphatase LuxQ [Vibrio maritimus]
MPLTDFNNRKTLATLITRTVIWVVGLFTIGMLVQSWHLSRDIVREEVQRSSRQTSALVVNYFNYRLATLQILQDSNAKSDAVENFFQSRDAQSLDYFFFVKITCSQLIHRIFDISQPIQTLFGMTVMRFLWA